MGNGMDQMDQEEKEEWLSGDYVAGVFDTEGEVESALGEFEGAGYPKQTIRVFSGPEGSESIGRIGGTGLGGILLRAAEDYAGNAKELTDSLKEEAARGHHVVIVPVEGAEAAAQIRHLFQDHSGHDVHERVDGSYQSHV
jgi:hypothetical protein